MKSCSCRFLSAPILACALLVAGPATAVLDPAATWLVTYDAPPTPAQIEALSAIASGVHAFQTLPVAAAVVPPDLLGVLANLPGVRGIYPNYILQPTLAQSTHTLRADGVWADGYTGAGIGIAVIDAGVDGTHPDLCAAIQFCNGTPIKTVQNVKILGDQEYLDPVVVLEDQISTDSSSGHGSHVSGIAAGWGVSSTTPGKYRGVAHGARLIGLGTGEVLEVVTVLAAFDWVLAHKDDPRYNIKVINNSWGPGAGAQYDANEPVQRAIAAAWDAGLSVVFGSGNDGPKTGTLNVFSANPKAISAAGGTKAGHIALFSSRGVPGSPLFRPTVTAPGQFIASIRAKTGFYADIADVSGPDPNNPILPPDDVYYAFASGTSMSSPHVAGVVALMQEAAIRNLHRYLSPAEVKNLLQTTAVSRNAALGPGGLPNYQGYSMGAGYADALAAVRALEVSQLQVAPYNDGVVEDARAFTGAIGVSGYFSNSSFETTYTVVPGAISLDVMIDWQHAAQNTAAQDLDIDLYRPDGTLYLSTTLYLGLEEGPNQYSSFVTTLPNERVNVNYPQAGAWRAVVHGNVSASETAYGLWSVVYPDGTALPAGQVVSTITVTVPATPGVVGRTAQVTAALKDASGNPVPNAPVTWTSTGVGSVVTSEPLSDERGRVLATINSESPGTQVVTAHSGTATGNASVSWLGLPVITPPVFPPPPANTPGKASGGGHFNNPNKRTFGFYAEYKANSSGPGGELSYDDKSGTKVKATGMSAFVITGGNKATAKGTASINGVGSYNFQLDVVDNGEPGSNDSFYLLLTNPAIPQWKYETSGTLGGGNVQVQVY